MKNVIVLGLGRFGSALAQNLAEKNIEVMAVDKDYNKVQKLAGDVAYTAQADITDPDALKELGIKNFDIAIIASGSNLESSIEATLLCKDAGIKTVISKATSLVQARILKKIGADRIIFPERDSGERLARLIAGSNLMEFIQFSNKFSMVEVKAHESWIGKSLKDLDFRNKFDLNVVAFERDGDMIVSPRPDEVIEEYDLLVIIGENKDIEKIEECDN